MGGLPLAFLAAWVVLGTALIVFAMFGGPAGARERLLHAQGRRGRRFTAVVLAVVFAAMGVAVPALVLASHDDTAGAARVKLTPTQEYGRVLFGQRCQQCHVLAAANAVGRVGPNLDELKPSADVVLDAIENGRARGQGRMPADIVQGEDAEAVASFVATVAGKQ